jgi:hypothetical protein
MLRLESLQGVPIAGLVPNGTGLEVAYDSSSILTDSFAESGAAGCDDELLWPWLGVGFVPGTEAQESEFTNFSTTAVHASLRLDALAVPAVSFKTHFPVKMQDGATQRACCRCGNLGAFGCGECGLVLCCKWRQHNVPDDSGGSGVKMRTCHGLYHSRADCHVSPVTTRRNAQPQLVSSAQDFGQTYVRHAPLSLKELKERSKVGTKDPRGNQACCVLCTTPTVFVCPCPECADVNGLPSALCWNTVSPGTKPICFVTFHESTPEAREQLKCKQRQRSGWNIADHASYLHALAGYQ